MLCFLRRQNTDWHNSTRDSQPCEEEIIRLDVPVDDSAKFERLEDAQKFDGQIHRQRLRNPAFVLANDVHHILYRKQNVTTNNSTQCSILRGSAISLGRFNTHNDGAICVKLVQKHTAVRVEKSSINLHESGRLQKRNDLLRSARKVRASGTAWCKQFERLQTKSTAKFCCARRLCTSVVM